MRKNGIGISVLVPAQNEAEWIVTCLMSLLHQDSTVPIIQVIVVANGCTDDTVKKARFLEDCFFKRGWELMVIDLPEPGKAKALNEGDRNSRFETRVYLDADVSLGPTVLSELSRVLDTDRALYGTGRLVVSENRSFFSRAYVRVWTRLPFISRGTSGAGLFAVNGAGRNRWGEWPEIISDDTFARLNFAPHERIEIDAEYCWPMVEGLSNLIRVRHRQNIGVAQVRQLYPELQINNNTHKPRLKDIVRIAASSPIGMLIYIFVQLAARIMPVNSKWTRGR